MYNELVIKNIFKNAAMHSNHFGNYRLELSAIKFQFPWLQVFATDNVSSLKG